MDKYEGNLLLLAAKDDASEQANRPKHQCSGCSPANRTTSFFYCFFGSNINPCRLFERNPFP